MLVDEIGQPVPENGNNCDKPAPLTGKFTNTGVQRAAQEMDRPQPERAGKRAKRGHWT